MIDSRQADDGRVIRRRRECENCGYRFTTFERIEEAPLLVIKKNGAREEFNRDKILQHPPAQDQLYLVVALLNFLLEFFCFII